jgi:hypothetical protein
MRLRKVERGHRLAQRFVLGIMRVLGTPPADVVRMLLYRPGLFGKPYSAWIQAVMRGPSDWTVGERALFGAFVSRTNRCPF